MNENRRTFLQYSTATLCAGALGEALPSAGFAKESTDQITLTGSKTWQIGDISCTALLDGVVQVDAAIFGTAEPDTLAALLAATGQPEGKINLDVNAYLLEIGGEKLLIDTGTRDIYGPTLGKLPEQLAALGVDTSEIGKVVLTHMHNDHTGGLTDAQGRAVFDQAELIVPAAEWDFWTSEDNFAQASDSFKFSFTGARAAGKAYQNRVLVMPDNADVMPGFSGIALPGHSIGHTGYRISSGRDQMIIWGDTVVSPELQFEHPEWASAFDADAEQSIASRKRIFDEVSVDRIFVAGMHLPFPGIGYVSRKDNKYRFESVV